MAQPLWRRALAEFLGTVLLLTAVVGSGIMAQTLSPHDVGLQLFENSTAIVFALAVLILVFGPISGAHFNPIVSVADWWLHRRRGDGLTARHLGVYAAGQFAGAIAGALLGNAMFAVAPAWSTKQRTGAHLWLGEVVATAALLLLIYALARTGRAALAVWAVPAYIGAACWFTSSASFANPAVTLARAFTNTFTGIAPASVPGFVMAEVVGLVVGVALVVVFYPDEHRDEAVVVADADDAAEVTTPQVRRVGPQPHHRDSDLVGARQSR